MKHIGSLVLLAVAATAGPALAEPSENTAEIPTGVWSGPCDAWGTPATCTSQWQPGLHKDLRVQEYAIVRQADDAPLFSGRGVYRLEGSSVKGYWEDSQGAIHPLTGSFEDGTVSVIWGMPSSQIGRSTYTFADGGMTARDSALTDDGWRQFMEVKYPAPGTTAAE